MHQQCTRLAGGRAAPSHARPPSAYVLDVPVEVDLAVRLQQALARVAASEVDLRIAGAGRDFGHDLVSWCEFVGCEARVRECISLGTRSGGGGNLRTKETESLYVPFSTSNETFSAKS